VRQILQNLKSGKTELVDVPAPALGLGQLLIRTRVSLISAGTERMLVDFGKAGFIDKARKQPDKVRQVLDKIKTDGLMPTLDAVMSKLDQPLPMGYSNVGVIREVGPGLEGGSFKTGDRVVSNGRHAEAVAVPVNLCARIPDSVSDEAAAFTILGAIALQGIRLLQPTLGEAFAVTGLGLIGLVTVQLLRAQGCRVLGIDVDSAKCAHAQAFGAETVDLSRGQDPVAAAEVFSRGHGMDGVLVTAATKSSEPIHQAALMCRKRGRIVLVGVTGLELSRADFYEKELSFQVSCSYGPGRYDPEYEEKGHDYPVGYVRWTEQRNFEAVLDMMADGRLDVAPLISHRFTIDRAEQAYETLVTDKNVLGILLEYPEGRAEADESSLFTPTVRYGRNLTTTEKQHARQTPASRNPAVGFVGAGNYAVRTLIPAFRTAGARLRTIASGGGTSGAYAGKKFGFSETTTDTAGMFADSGIDAIVIATRHDSHARLVKEALEAGKHVFVEKPLCLTLEELEGIRSAYLALPCPLVVTAGFNRRFAPHVTKIKELLDSVSGPKAFIMTVNAGRIPADHWTQDRATGGGRIIGEACHFIDLLRFLAGHPVSAADSSFMADPARDSASMQIVFTDGSIGTVHYLANGSKHFPKERLEVFTQGRILQLDNFRVLRGFGWPGFSSMRLWRQDKGQTACVKAFLEAVNGAAPAPISFDELMEVAETTIHLARSDSK
jgi:predicted dehydrogenase/threonine dehydrogenase-like Zn-dependent dehydrogenase